MNNFYLRFFQKLFCQIHTKWMCLLPMLSSLVFVASCSDEELTPLLAMDKFEELSPLEGAQFYKENRVDYPFLDTLYTDSIVPALLQCNYYELKDVSEELEGLPLDSTLNDAVSAKRESFLKTIVEEIQENNDRALQSFEKSILPAIQMDVDSMLEKDVESVLDQYSGGLFNYKKLMFFFGRDNKEFKKMFWEKMDTAKYISHVEEHVTAYLDSIGKYQKSYSLDIVQREFDGIPTVETPNLVVGLSKSTMKHIQKYTKGEADDILVEGFRDYVAPLFLTAGWSILYDIGTTAYDIAITIDDIKKNKPNSDEMAHYICAHDISYQIENFFLKEYTERVIRAVTESNNKLYKFIDENL